MTEKNRVSSKLFLSECRLLKKKIENTLEKKYPNVCILHPFFTVLMVGIQCPIQSNLLFLRWQSNSINSRTIQISNKAWYHIPFFSKPTKHFLSHSIWCIFFLVHYCLVCKKWLVFWCRYTRDYDPDRHLKSQPGFFIIILVFSPKPNPYPQDFFKDYQLYFYFQILISSFQQHFPPSVTA